MTHIYHEKRPGRRFRLEHIYGDCLERIGIRNAGGGYAVVDRCAKPKVGDIVHCAKEGVNISSYIKQIKRIEGDIYIVGTAYPDPSRDFEFEAGEIYGVVTETYGKTSGLREYVRPAHLQDKEPKPKKAYCKHTDACMDGVYCNAGHGGSYGRCDYFPDNGPKCDYYEVEEDDFPNCTLSGCEAASARCHETCIYGRKTT